MSAVRHAARLLIAVAVLVACARREDGRTRDAEPATAPPPPTAPARFDAAVDPPPRAVDERVIERERLVSNLAARGIQDPRVLAALRAVPRHAFVPEAVRSQAYTDRPLSIGHGQTISQPYIVAFMSEAARIEATDRCLEIGTGSGYQAAVLAELCAETYSIEYLPEVAAQGEKNLRSQGYDAARVALRVGDGYRGWPERAPFQTILVTAAPERVPAPLLAQLAVGGRLIIPVGQQRSGQDLERWLRVAAGSEPSAFRTERLLAVRFVPFLGEGH